MEHPPLSDLLQDGPKGLTSDLSFLSGGGEMGERIRAKDWSKTSLGPIASWPHSLRTAVSICLASDLPICIIWGPDIVQIYNDGYRVICGEKHPRSMGQNFAECWREAWPVIGDAHDSALAGDTAFLENQHIFLERHGYVEECFFTFSFSPIRDETGRVVGLFHPVIETTAKMLGERRTRGLREVAARTANAQTVQEACALAAQSLAVQESDVPFALMYVFDGVDASGRLVASTGIPDSAEGNAMSSGMPQSWPLAEVPAERQGEVVEKFRARFGNLRSGPYPESPREAVALPLVLPGSERPVGVLIAGVSGRLQLNQAYRDFYELLGAAVTTAVANGRAFEAERKRAEALAEIDRAKTAFFSNVSHEFRTPLTLMLGPVEDLLVRSHTDLSPAAKGQLEVVNRNGLRLLRLVNNLLDFSRVEAGRVQAVYEPTDLATFTAELASCFRSATERAGLKLIVDCPPLPEPIYVDRDMWEKIVLNLLSNAFKFTFEGEIEVSLKEDKGLSRLSGLSCLSGDQTDRTDQIDQTDKIDQTDTPHVILSVRDTGVGIPGQELTRLFERFHRIEKTRSRTHEGSGIGLALVQELVKLHSGSVRVESRSGEGSTFIVTVPKGSAHLPAEKISARRSMVSTSMGAGPFVEEALRWLPENGGLSGLSGLSRLSGDQTDRIDQIDRIDKADSRTRRPRILIADDNADMRQYIGRLLQERYVIETAPDGEAALEAVRKRRPDLIVTDVMMPRLDGFGLLRELRAEAGTKTIPVILLSARAGEESRIEGLEQGADDYLIKPFSARELLARVHSQLELARLRHEAGEELRRSEERFARFMQHLPGLAWIKDEQGRYVYGNDAAQKAFQMLQERLYGKTDEDIFAPEVAAQFRENDRRALTSGTGVQVVETFEHQDGLLHHSIVSKFPIPGSDGQTALIGGIAIDITERKAAEEALRESDARFRTLADNMSQFAWMADAAGWIFWYNRRWYEYTGTTLEQMQGWGWKAVHHPDHVDRVVDRIQRSWDTGELWEDTFPLRGQDGVYRWFLSRAVPIRDLEGRIVRWFGTNTDITELRDMEAGLRESEEKLHLLADRLEHRVAERTYELAQSEDHLRTMATELNLAEQRERKRLATELHDHLQQTLVLGKLTIGQGKRVAAEAPACQQIFKKVDDIFSDALTYTRTLVSDLSPTVLRDHGLAASLQWLGTYMQKHNQTVSVTAPDDEDLKLPEDQVILLFQSVRELLINSSKHAGTGQATVRMEQRDGLLRIDVRDEGAGFDLAAAAAAAAAAGTPSGGISSKFGLFSIRERMQALGGSFEIESAPGKGTTATLVLPLGKPRVAECLMLNDECSVRKAERRISDIDQSDASGHSTLKIKHSTFQQPANRIRVLLVDDHIMIRQGLRSVLDAYADIELVGEAGNGKEGIQMVDQLRPAVVVMDINMPKMNGIEATVHIKLRYPETIVIGLSVNAAGENQEAMKRAGAVRLLTKEAAVEELYDAIQRAVRSG